MSSLLKRRAGLSRRRVATRQALRGRFFSLELNLFLTMTDSRA